VGRDVSNISSIEETALEIAFSCYYYGILGGQGQSNRRLLRP